LDNLQVRCDEVTEESIMRTKGFLLIDWPRNKKQAAMLEKTLSDFTEDSKRKSPHCVYLAEQTNPMYAMNIDIPRQHTLEPSGLDLFLQVNVTIEEALRRVFGRRVDPETGVLYHLDDRVPPYDQPPLVERLMSIHDNSNTEELVAERMRNYEQEFQ